MGVLLGDRDNIITQLDAFCESWSLEKFLRDQNPTNPVLTQHQDSKISDNETKLSSVDIPISTVTPELASK